MSEIRTNFPVFLLVALGLVFLNPAMAFADSGCREATFIDINTTLRSHGGGAVVSECFETYLPSAGILMLDVSAPIGSPAEPKLAHRPCGHSKALQKPLLYKDRSATSMLLEIRHVGTYSFCVAAQDPAQFLGEYKIVNGFAPLTFQKENPDEDEPEPETLVFDPSCPANPTERGEYADGILIGGFYKENPDEDEPEPETLVDSICRANTVDDHSQISRCATPIHPGQEIGAEIRNEWADDQDIFSFELDRLTSVHLETTGDSDTLGALYDHRGYLLKADDDGGRGNNFRIVKTLSPGKYFVRVEGSRGTEGAYQLLVIAEE